MSDANDDPLRNLPVVQSPQPERNRAAGWQIALTTLAAITIVAVFLWGVSNQRSEGGREQPAATQSSSATPPPANPQVAAPAHAQDQRQTLRTTTGAGGSDENHASRDSTGASKKPDQKTRNSSKGPAVRQ